MNADIFYLLLLPLQSAPPRGRLEPALAKKDTPYFLNLDIEFLSLGDTQLMIENTPIQVNFKVLDSQIWLAECHYQVDDVFSEVALEHKQVIQTSLKEKCKHQTGYSGVFTEEYTILVFGKVEQSPDGFVDQHATNLARWLRTIDKPLTDTETKEILSSRVRYSEGNLTIVDWEGAIIITEEGQFLFDLTLFKIGNYQLLRYRLLDRAIEKNLQQLRRYVNQRRPIWLSSKYKKLRQIIEQRLDLLLGFEKTDQSLLLIGDWYSARVYRLIVEQFCLNDWKTIVESKLDSMVAINDIVYQDLAFSWRRFFDFVMIVGWLILLVGYFILFFANLR